MDEDEKERLWQVLLVRTVGYYIVVFVLLGIVFVSYRLTRENFEKNTTQQEQQKLVLPKFNQESTPQRKITVQ